MEELRESETLPPVAYRHEIKHTLDRMQMAVLISRMTAVMHKDAHARPDGTYFIRSLYFDNDTDVCLREKQEGVPRREKYRIRYYNGDVSFIRLEKKTKLDALTAKASAVLTKEQCENILSGQLEFLRTDPQPLCRELYVMMRTRGYRPKTIVDYTRRTLVHPLGNTRVTFDYDIRTGSDTREFLNPAYRTMATDAAELLPTCVLEVKYDHFLPEFIRDALQIENCRVGAFSKYETCRRFG